jgi:hypothetical protein
MAIVGLLKALGRVLGKVVAKLGFDNIAGVTDRASDLAGGQALHEIVKDQALDVAGDAGSHVASKATAHVARTAAHPFLAKASAFMATRIGFVGHAFNVSRYGAQVSLATTARGQVVDVDTSDKAHALFPWVHTAWGPYAVIAAAIGFSLAFGRFSGLEESKWGAAGITAFSSFVGDALLNSDEPGWAWEALMVAFFGAVISLAISATPLGKKVENSNKKRNENRAQVRAARA